MKSKFFVLAAGLFSIAALTQSCKSSKSSTQAVAKTEETTEMADPAKARIDRFVSVEAVLDLRAGMSMEEATTKLGGKPYNVFSAQADGHHIVQYKYRLSKIEVNAEDVNNYGLEKKNNKLYYAGGAEDLYLVFNGAGKLEYMATTQGAMSEKLLRENNLLYVIKKDKDKFATDADKSYRQTNAGVFYPLLPCNNCEKKEDAKPAEEKNTIKIKLEPAGKN
jgi:hypothetical protein